MADDLMIIDQSTGEVTPYEGGIGIEESRAIAESQAGFVIAKRFPRNREQAKLAIMRECESVRLAEEAEFAFPKGNKTVHGASIRLLEVIAQNWGNISSGVRELEVRDDDTLMQAFAYDLETNAREERMFTVPNFIMLKGGQRKYLEDPRDLYELRANMGARRKRACLEAVIPRHIIDEAVDICRDTVIEKGTPVTPENIEKMVAAFEEIGVTEEMLELRQQKKLKALTGPEFRALKRIYKGIEDGITTTDKVFGDESLTQPKEKAPPKAKAKKKAPAKKKAAGDPGDKSGEKSESPGEPPPDPTPPPPEPSRSQSAAAQSESATEEPLPLGGKMVGTLPTITDQLEVVKFIKEGTTTTGNAWTLYHVTTANGTKLACFDKKLIEKAEKACEEGELVELEYKESAKGKTIEGIEIIG